MTTVKDKPSKKKPSDYPHMNFRPTKDQLRNLVAIAIRRGQSKNSLLREWVDDGIRMAS